jgi:putative DNA primase/helicase
MTDDARGRLRVVQNQAQRTLPSPQAPLDAARLFVDQKHRTADGKLALHFWQGQWWQWQNTHWIEVERVAVEATAYQFFDGARYESAKGELVAWNPTRHKVMDLLAAAQTITHLSRRVTQPCWTNGHRHDGVIVSVANGLLDVRHGVLLPHTADYFNVVSVPFAFDPDAPPPDRWLGFLRSLWEDDEQPALLQEWFGYIISGRTDLHKIASLIGPTRAGKGVIARILGHMIGTENVAGPTLSSFASDFGLAPLLGKPLAVIGDARLNGKGDHSHVVEVLLSISGEDVRTVNIKYKEQWTGRMPPRFMSLSNELPRFTDASGTIANRFLPMTLTQSWLGNEDRSIEPDIVAAELPGVLNWALAGLARLELQGRFTWPHAADAAITRLQDLASPVHAFIRDCCTIDTEARTTVDDLWAAWKTWASDNGHTSGTKQLLGRSLSAAFPHIRIRRNRHGLDAGRFYDGIRLGIDPEVVSADSQEAMAF